MPDLREVMLPKALGSKQTARRTVWCQAYLSIGSADERNATGMAFKITKLRYNVIQHRYSVAGLRLSHIDTDQTEKTMEAARLSTQPRCKLQEHNICAIPIRILMGCSDYNSLHH